MIQRNFNNTTTVGTLTGPIAASAVTATVTNFNNAPAVPFTVTVDRNAATEEICLVTAVTGGTLTLVRGYDGTASQAHSAGATIEHTAGALEYTEANQHNNATSNVHGSTGTAVGNQGAQTIYDKTLVSPVCQADPTKGDAVVAYTPPGASAKNLFSGKGTDGATKFTVDSSGNVIGAGVSLTTLNTTVAGHTTSINANTTNITANTNSITGLGTSKADRTYVDSQNTATLNSAKAYADGLPADTGEITFTPNTPITVGGGGAYYRKVGKVVSLNLDSNHSGSYANGFVLTTLPTGYKPSHPIYFQAVAYNGANVAILIDTTGAVTMAIPGTISYTGLYINYTFLVP